MEIQLYGNESSKDLFSGNKNLDLSFLINIKNQKLLSKSDNTFNKENITIKFNINNAHSLDKYEKIYYQKYLEYINKELNSKVISMLFNYISSSSVIPNYLKKNCFFITKFLKIIKILLLNEIELVIMTLILDNIGLIIDDLDRNLYYINLAAKYKASSDYKILLNILNKNNFEFSYNFKQWLNNSDIQKILQNLNIININKRFNELRQPFYLNDNQKKFINYNEIANIISKIPTQTKSNKNINTTIFPSIQSNTYSNDNNQNILLMTKSEGFSNIPFDIPSPNTLNISKQESIKSENNRVKQISSPNKIIDYLKLNNSIGEVSELNPVNSYIPFEQDNEGI